MPRQRPCLDPSMLVEFTKVRHRLLDHPLADPHAAHQAPVAVDLAVLLANRMAQVHAPPEPPPPQKKMPKVVTTRRRAPFRSPNPLIHKSCRDKSTRDLAAQLRKLG